MRKISSRTRILAAVLAFMVAFTYMPFGMWAAESHVWADSVTEISSAEEFAAMDANGSYKLADDITVSQPYSEDFTGTFDGDGHTVTLAIESTGTYTGLFKVLAGGATVKNLITAGSVTVTGKKQSAGGIAAQANPYTGPVTIENCLNKAEVTAYKGIGGIVGHCTQSAYSLTIRNCGNTGTITGSNTQVGGIAGNLEKSHTVINCYNTGNITGFNQYGGVIGRASTGVAISNVYSTGTVTAAGSSPNAGYALVGGAGSASTTPFSTIDNAYAINGAAADLIYTTGITGTNCAFKTANEMKSADFAALLGEEFVEGETYPELASIKAMQVPSAKVVFNVATEGATITINGKKYSSCSANLPAGSYSYTVAKEGYASQSGNFEITEAQANNAETVNVPEEAITLNEYTVKSIVLDTDNAKKVYDQHESLELEGVTLTVAYEETEETTVIEGKDFDKFGVVCSGYDLSVPGTTTVTVEYKGKSAGYELTVNEALSLGGFFTNCEGVSVQNDATYKFAVNGTVAQPEYVQSTNPKGESSSMVLTFTKNCRFSFSHYMNLYSTSTASNYLSVSVNHGGTVKELLKVANYSKAWAGFSADIAAGDVVTITCKNNTNEDNGGNYVRLKDFSAVELHNIRINPTPADAEVTVKDADGKTVSGTDNTFLVGNGIYQYTVSKFGYEQSAGTITVADADVEETVTLAELSNRKVTFVVTLPEGVTGNYAVEVKSGTTVINANEDGTYSLPAGEYSYKITHPNCEDKTGTVTVADSDSTVEVTMDRKWVIGDYFTGLPVEASNGTYGFVLDSTDSTVLASNNQSKSTSSATLTLVAKADGELSFKYKVGSEASYDKFNIKNGTKSIVENKSGTVDWTEVVTNVKAGDTLTFTYSKDSSGDKNGDTVWLKDFALEATYKLTITAETEGAQIEVLDANGKAVSAAGNEYSVKNGTYTYTTSLFGYESKTGTVTINGADQSVTVPALTKIETKAINFNVTLPENVSGDYTLVVKSGDNTIAAEEDGIYLLPAGEYTYKITHPGCEDKTGSFTVADADQTVEVTMVKKWVIGDYFTGLSLEASNGTYGFVLDSTDSSVLASNNQSKSGSSATLTLTVKADGQLSFKYKVSTEAKYDKFNIKNGSASLVTDASGVADWTDVTTKVKTGDTLTFTYSKDSSGDKNNDTVWLKEFELKPVYSVTVNTATEGAKVELFDANDKALAGEGNVYELTDGQYTYKVSKFGYETVTGTLTVAGEKQTVDVPALTVLETKTVSFAVTPEDAAVTLTHKTAGTMNAENGVYTVPAGETFKYTVEKADYITQEGTITVADNMTVTADLIYAGEAWDGTAKVEPELKEGVYQIGNGAQLAWFADYVANTDNTASAVLTDNINLNNKTWTTMGKYNASGSTYANEYAGTFDGQNHTITGLNTTSGLFQYVTATGNVKNLVVSGNIAASSYCGGIAGSTAGIIENCAVYGSVTSTGSNGIGGIAGRVITGGSLVNCANFASVTCNYSYYNSSLSIGGVAGYTYGNITNCYNAGDVYADPAKTSNHEIAGLVGDIKSAAAAITNCYNTGNVNGPADGSFSFAGGNQGTIENSYVLEGAGPAKAIGGTSNLTGVEVKTAAQMKEDAFVIALDAEKYNKDTAGLNKGYPVLKWQGGTVVRDQNAEDVAAAKLALDVNPKEFKEAGTIELPASAENEVTVTWTCDSDCINTETGAVTLPEEGIATVNLTAVLTKGSASETKNFEIKVWSVKAQVLDELNVAASKIDNSSVWAQEIIHPEESNVTQVVKRYLEEKGVDTADMAVEFVSAGEKVIPAADETVNIADNGDITYFTGFDDSSMFKYAQYSNVKVQLVKNGESVEVPFRLFISWDCEYVQHKLESLARQIKWADIRGENTTDVDPEKSYTGEDDYAIDCIAGVNSGTLKLPAHIGTATIEWKPEQAEDAKAKVEIEEAYKDNELYYECKLTGSPYEDEETALFAVLTFNLLNDGEAEFVEGDETYPTVYGTKAFQFAIEKDENATVVDTELTLNNLSEKYESLIADFVTKNVEDVNLSAVTDDLHMPTPGDLEDAEILLDREHEKVEMISSDENSLFFYGYHAIVYRPMPGEKDKTVEYTVRILDRITEKLIAEKTFSMTIKAISQDEINKAAEVMKKVATNDVYWNGLKGDNEDKNSIVENMKPFSEIHFDADGENIEYIRGAINMNFGGIELDDLPGYDAMQSQPWREIRSSRETIVSSEQLLVTRPEHNTKLTLDSVMTYNRYAKYWEKALEDEALKTKYAEFEQFYKQPVSVTITVLGTAIEDPDNPIVEKDTISVKVAVNGGEFEGFKNISEFTFEKENVKDYSAWDCVKACLEENGYTWQGSGSYISAVTDSDGVTLEELEHGDMSGWMYKVNGELPDKTLSQMFIKDGDAVEFFYVGEEPVHEHTVVADKAVAATCTETGLTEGSHCSVCGEVLVAQEVAPALGHTTEIQGAKKATCKAEGYTGDEVCTVCKETVKTGEVTEKIAHTYKTVVTKKATTKADGEKVSKCSDCGDVKSTSVIKKIGKVTLSKTKYVYDGKKKKPVVTVKNSAGTTIKPSYFTVASKNNTKVGIATVTITFIGNYKGTVKKRFKINPVKTSINKLTKGTKAFTVKWTKKTTQVTGCQIRYSTNSKMSNAKKVTVKSNKTTNKKIKNLKASKKYYVQVRTYKTVDGTKYYSAWSKAKSVTTK